MDQKQELVYCQEHQLQCIFSDDSREQDQNRKYFCIKCLIIDHQPKCPQLLSETTNHFQEFLNVIKEKILTQNKSNLQIFKELEDNVCSLKNYFKKCLNTINESIKQFEEILKKLEKKIKKMNVNSFLKSPQDFQFQKFNIDISILQTQMDKLYEKSHLEIFVNLLKKIDSNQAQFEQEDHQNPQPNVQVVQAEQKKDPKFKIVLIGDTKVGKTSIINSYMKKEFTEFQEPTVGIDFTARTIQINEKNVKFQLWDTAGQVRFKSLLPSYIRDSNVAALCYDITEAQSFKNIQNWLEMVRNERGKDVLCILIANKIDLGEIRVISIEDGQKFAQEHNLLYYEISAKDFQNVETFFNNIAQRLIEQ